eukprot:TRINITY_DN37790_c0_g1_i1.p1 TRINITY_DN37790_c0_g1~~TRINITY_DN37790_c0_g1_i1.p1  ORF type:complete len:675 (-),score=103.28 TRINITY_DN37790_c0_g1_i1:200-2224(-)
MATECLPMVPSLRGGLRRTIPMMWDYPLSTQEKRERVILVYQKETVLMEKMLDCMETQLRIIRPNSTFGSWDEVPSSQTCGDGVSVGATTSGNRRGSAGRTCQASGGRGVCGGGRTSGGRAPLRRANARGVGGCIADDDCAGTSQRHGSFWWRQERDNHRTRLSAGHRRILTGRRSRLQRRDAGAALCKPAPVTEASPSAPLRLPSLAAPVPEPTMPSPQRAVIIPAGSTPRGRAIAALSSASSAPVTPASTPILTRSVETAEISRFMAKAAEAAGAKALSRGVTPTCSVELPPFPPSPLATAPAMLTDSPPNRPPRSIPRRMTELVFSRWPSTWSVEGIGGADGAAGGGASSVPSPSPRGRGADGGRSELSQDSPKLRLEPLNCKKAALPWRESPGPRPRAALPITRPLPVPIRRYWSDQPNLVPLISPPPRPPVSSVDRSRSRRSAQQAPQVNSCSPSRPPRLPTNKASQRSAATEPVVDVPSEWSPPPTLTLTSLATSEVQPSPNSVRSVQFPGNIQSPSFVACAAAAAAEEDEWRDFVESNRILEAMRIEVMRLAREKLKQLGEGEAVADVAAANVAAAMASAATLASPPALPPPQMPLSPPTREGADAAAGVSVVGQTSPKPMFAVQASDASARAAVARGTNALLRSDRIARPRTAADSSVGAYRRADR